MDPGFQCCYGILNKKKISLFHQILFYQEADYYGSSARARLQSEAKMVSSSYVETSSQCSGRVEGKVVVPPTKLDWPITGNKLAAAAVPRGGGTSDGNLSDQLV